MYKWLSIILLLLLVHACSEDPMPAQEMTDVRIIRKIHLRTTVSKVDSIPLKSEIPIKVPITSVQTVATPVIVFQDTMERPSTPRGNHHVIVGSLMASERADLAVVIKQLEDRGFYPETIEAGNRIRISIGGFATQAEAQQMRDKYVAKTGKTDSWIWKKP